MLLPMDVAPENLEDIVLLVHGHVEGQHDRLSRANAHTRSLWCLHQRASAVELERPIVEHGRDNLMAPFPLFLLAYVCTSPRDEQAPSQPALALCDMNRLIFH